MASYLVFYFLFLFSYFLLLLSAAPEWDTKCAKEKVSCGYLGEISFPFTTVDKRECGLYIIGCDNNSSVKTINLINQTYEIDSISYMNNSAIIYGLNSSELEPIKNKPNFSINTVNFYVCNHGYDNSHDNKFKYKNCADYDIYFTSTPDKPPMFPIFPLACFPVPFETFNCVDIISLLEIKVDLESCEGCYLEGKSCLLNQETLNFTCGPVLKPPIPKRNDRHLKNAVIGLSIGLATTIAIALFVITLVLYYWRIKS
ncbi:uncharacterized protein [Medicago truncatula]|uniref:uncharacterized protein n=1 Tax=Medicago truncatula TaxID=3880 RepID=UPI000D2F46E5|nr:uncharacterized protein LOC11442138 [Medicago truncatula]